MKEPTEQSKKRIIEDLQKQVYDYRMWASNQQGNRPSIKITDVVAVYFIHTLSKDQPVVGAEEYLKSKGYWRSYKDPKTKEEVHPCWRWDRVVSEMNGFASAVASKMARENEELKGRVRELESALRWVLWNAHIPSGLGEERVKEIEELITPKDINGNPLNSKTN